MASSDTDICNIGLARIGEDLLTSYEADNSRRAMLCRKLYPVLKKAVMRNYPWAFALRRQSLAQVSGLEDVYWNWDYVYQLPTDPKCLRVLDTSQDDYGYRWVVEGSYLLTNAPTITIRYIAQIDEPGLYDSQFVEAMGARMAWALAKSITGDDDLVKDCRAEFLMLAGEAHASDSMETTEDEGDQGASELNDVRFG
jgi:hypothetical protein